MNDDIVELPFVKLVHNCIATYYKYILNQRNYIFFFITWSEII